MYSCKNAPQNMALRMTLHVRKKKTVTALKQPIRFPPTKTRGSSKRTQLHLQVDPGPQMHTNLGKQACLLTGLISRKPLP